MNQTMSRKTTLTRLARCVVVLLTSNGLAAGFFASAAGAQAPPSIQIFMPDGSLPPREIRFMLTNDQGVVETFHTDSKGRFLITRRDGLRPDATYTITILGDGRSFATTTHTFRQMGVYYIPIFLNPLEEPPTRPAGTIDVNELDDRAPEEARRAYESAQLALAEDRASEAVERFRYAIELYPKYFRAINDLGVLLIRLNRVDEAAKAFEKATQIAPHVYYPHLNLASIKVRQGKYKEATAILEKLQKAHPKLPQIRLSLTEALLLENRFDEAEEHLRILIQEKGIDGARLGNVHYRLGLIYNRKGKYEEAAKELREGLKHLPNAPRLRLQLGAALLQLNQLEEAESELKLAYSLEGAALGGAQLLLGQVYYTQKKYELAMKAFERYLTDVPNAPNKAEVSGVIAKIKAALQEK